MSTGQAFWPPMRPSFLPCCSMTFWMSGRPGSHCAVSARPTSTLLRMNREPAVFVLVIEPGLANCRPGLFERDRLHSPEDVVRNLRTAVRETLALPVRRVLDEQFASLVLPGCANAGSLHKSRTRESSMTLHVHPFRSAGSNHGVSGTCALRALPRSSRRRCRAGPEVG